MTGAPLRGGCLCGAVRYRIEGPPASVGLCHCSLCRRNTGAVYAVLAVFPADRLVHEGAGQHSHDTPNFRRYFCPRCGSATYMANLREPEIELHVGSLDDPAALVPTFEEWAGAAVAWVPRDPGWDSHAHWRNGPEPGEGGG